MSPSAVSQQMSVLEREAGVALLERSGRGVKLTEAGRRLVAHTERVLATLEEAQADLAAISHGFAGRLHTSAFPTAARALMVPVLAGLRKLHPRLAVAMTDLEPEESIPALKTGDLDIVLTYEFDHLPEPEDPGVERHVLLTEPIYIALPESHPCATGPLAIADLRGTDWVVGRDGSPFLDVVVRVANEAGYQPRIDIQSNDYQVILAAVQAGLGVTLVPPLAFFVEYPGVVYRLPDDMNIHRRVVAAIRRGSGEAPAIGAAVDLLREVAGEIESAARFREP